MRFERPEMTALSRDVDLTYAIGDIHGYAQLLGTLLDVIAVHAAGRSHRVVTLGDYVNKGPDSAGALRMLMSRTAAAPDRFVSLMGNHDLALLRAAQDPAEEAKFASMGGLDVLAQFGVATAVDLPADVVDWVAQRPTWCSDGLRYFVHAGLDARLPLAQQTDEVRLSMRGRFLTEDHDFGQHVVHGHTPQMTGQPTFRPFRTNLDTGVYQTGVLSAVCFRRQDRHPFALAQATTETARVQDLDGSRVHG
jgi:serine/threonine protein phosphatase 1